MALRLPMWGGFESFSNVRDIPFIARHATKTREEVCKLLKIPADKPIVLSSFGGYGLPGLDTDLLAKFKKYTVITTANVPMSRARKDTPLSERKGSFVSINEEGMYDAGVRYEDLVAASEAVVTKPGYGIIAEAIANDAAILYTSRGHFPEYDVLVEEMPKYVRSAFFSHDDLFNGKWETHLDKLLAHAKPKKKPETNGADVAAEILLKALDKPPKKPRGRPKTKA
jgi:L-arabinokinase